MGIIMNIRRCFAISAMLLLAVSACAEEPLKRLMERYLWTKRVLLVFSPEPTHPAFAQQNAILAAAAVGLDERDLVIWRLVHNESVSVDAQRMAQLGTPAFYDYFQVKPDEFVVLLLGKDGTEKLRQTQPLAAEALFDRIDSMPMRQQEMQKR